LVDLLTTVVFTVTAMHEWASDNLPYVVHPRFQGVRMPKGADGLATVQSDLQGYIMGMTVSVLTTLRSPPLFMDWSHLFDDEEYPASRRLRELHHEYKFRLMELSTAMFKEFRAAPQNNRSLVFNPATHGSSVAV
jgi:hypothetical protein